MTLHTTFNLLKLAGACGQERGAKVGYGKLATHLGGTKAYGKNTPIPLTVVLDSNGLDDALWCLSAVMPEEEAQRDREARLLACDYAEHVLPIYEAQYPKDTRVRDCIATARRYANGEATTHELSAARDAVRAAVSDAARAAVSDAVRAAAWAAARAAASDAAWAAVSDAARAAAWAAARAAASDAARAAVSDAVSDAELAWQTAQYRQMLEATA